MRLSVSRGVWFLAVLTWSGTLYAQTPEKPELADYFGFLPVEIFKLTDRSQNLLIGDVNQDGKPDVVICDNSHSRIDLLEQRGKSSEVSENSPNRLNSFASDPRFLHEKLPLDRATAALALGDFNKDGRLDFAYLAVPDRLVVRFQSEEGTWKKQISLRLPDIQPAQWILAAGDLDHDQQDDLAVLGRKETFVFLKLTEKELPHPLKLMNTNDRPGLLQIQDLNGDGRNDMSYLTNNEGTSSLSVRFQTLQGELGPELQFDLEGPRALHFANLDQEPGAEVVSIHARTGRVRIHKFTNDSSETGDTTSQLVQFGLPGSGSRDQALAIGDVTGDGRNDVVSTDPDSAEFILYPQSDSTGLAHGLKFPTLMGGTQVQLANVDQQKGDEILILSPQEKTIGLSRYEEGRITFPKPLPIQGEPVLMEVLPLDPETGPALLYVSRSTKGSEYTAYVLKPSPNESGELGWMPVPLGSKPEFKLPVSKAPERILIHREGDTRILLLFSGGDKPPKIFQIKPDFELVELNENGPGSGGLLVSKSVQLAMLDQPVVMVSQGNVARSLVFKESTGFEILDQYNTGETGVNIVSVTALDFDGEPGTEIALIDQGTRKIRFLRKEQETYRPFKEVELGPFACTGSQTADVNGDSRPDLILTGKGRFGVLYAGGTEYHLKELAVFESQLEDVHFQDVTVGDLNHDGNPDLALIDTKSHRVQIVSYFPEVGLKPALSFKLFDSKALTKAMPDDQEPRESVIADVTGDGLQDLLLLTHDRLLLYPQDNGSTDQTAENQATVSP